MNLLKSFGDKPGFVSVDLFILYALGPVDPYAYGNFPPRRKGNQIPSLVLEEGFVLLLHGRFPKGISSSLAIRLWILILNQEKMPGRKRFSGSEF
jgi:hypothetical protein